MREKMRRREGKKQNFRRDPRGKGRNKIVGGIKEEGKGRKKERKGT